MCLLVDDPSVVSISWIQKVLKLLQLHLKIVILAGLTGYLVVALENFLLSAVKPFCQLKLGLFHPWNLHRFRRARTGGPLRFLRLSDTRLQDHLSDVNALVQNSFSLFLIWTSAFQLFSQHSFWEIMSLISQVGVLGCVKTLQIDRGGNLFDWKRSTHYIKMIKMFNRRYLSTFVFA